MFGTLFLSLEADVSMLCQDGHGIVVQLHHSLDRLGLLLEEMIELKLSSVVNQDS